MNEMFTPFRPFKTRLRPFSYSRTPEATSFDQEVANEVSRLLLTGISVGWKVKQTDTSAIWRYNGPSAAVAGMAAIGITGTTGNNAIYTFRGTNNSRPYYNILGEITSTTESALVYLLDSGGGNPGWTILSAFSITVSNSESSEATPDLVSVWIGFESPVVTPVTLGELLAGVTITGSTVTLANDTYKVVGLTERGRNVYAGLLNGGTLKDPGEKPWQYSDNDPQSENPPTAFPWEAVSFTESAVVTRNDIASLANWSLI